MPSASRAVEKIDFSLTGTEDPALLDRLRNASVLTQTLAQGATQSQDLFSAALADYQRLLETLYAQGRYSGIIHIYVNGREAASFPPLSPPKTVQNVKVTVTPGPVFALGQARVAPLPDGAELPEGFRPGSPAKSGLIRQSAQAGVEAWRQAGYAKAKLAQQSLIADHRRNTLDVTLSIVPGQQLTFGTATPRGDSAVRAERIQKMAGLPEGEVFSPKEVEKSATRLRRTGAFQSVVIKEADQPNPDGSLDFDLEVVDALPRRFGAGVEISNQSGLALSGFWMHRNFLGGAERFRVDGEVSDIGGNSAIDYRLGVRLERPGLVGADTGGFVFLDLSSSDQDNFRANTFETGIGATRVFNDTTEGSLGLTFSHADVNDAFGARRFTLLHLPIRIEQDLRDDALNPSKGRYLSASITPFVGLRGEEAGAQLTFDGRLYQPISDGVTAAARVQVKSVVGSSLAGTSPDFLFFSGGGGTVRGQPFQSLGVPVGTQTAGGRSFLGLSGEVRGALTNSLSLVGFYDLGYIGTESLYDGSGAWHAGAGLGLRYNTAVGPIRMDVAVPTSGDTGSGVQLYVGIGQAF